MVGFPNFSLTENCHVRAHPGQVRAYLRHHLHMHGSDRLLVQPLGLALQVQADQFASRPDRNSRPGWQRSRHLGQDRDLPEPERRSQPIHLGRLLRHPLRLRHAQFHLELQDHDPPGLLRRTIPRTVHRPDQGRPLLEVALENGLPDGRSALHGHG